MITISRPTSRRWRAIGTWCELIVSAPGADTHDVADAALRGAMELIDGLDLACSRFRPDSELMRLPHGTSAPISAVLDGALAAALRTARATGGLVDPTVAAALVANGYDADLDVVRGRDERTATDADARPAPGHWRIYHDPVHREVLGPASGRPRPGCKCEGLGGRSHRSDAAVLLGSAGLDESAGLLINLGGDLAVGGVAPRGGWRIRVDDGPAPHDQTAPATGQDQADPCQPVVTIYSGGLATSSTIVRTWRHGGQLRHHILDPRTGRTAPTTWRAVTVAARTCELANAASTAAIVLGPDAPDWLAARGLHARLRAADGSVTRVGDWPEENEHERTALGRHPGHRTHLDRAAHRDLRTRHPDQCAGRRHGRLRDAWSTPACTAHSHY